MDSRRKWYKTLAVAALATFVVGSTAAFESNSYAAQPNTKQSVFNEHLPIGDAALPEHRSVEHQAQGVTITSVYRGFADSKAFFTVTVASVKDRDTAVNTTDL